MVVLPAPLRPTSAATCPAGIDSETPSRTRPSGREKLTWSNSIAPPGIDCDGTTAAVRMPEPPSEKL
jgi:hypothetical protein